MQIRLATSADIRPIAELHAANWLIAYRGILSDDYLDHGLLAERLQLWTQRFAAPEAWQQVFIADSDGHLAGFACAFGRHDAEHGTLLENLHVAADHRGQGIGEMLMQSVAQWNAQHFPGLGLHLWALAGNAPARRFYERRGGVVTGQGFWSPPVGPEVAELRYSWPAVSGNPLGD